MVSAVTRRGDGRDGGRPEAVCLPICDGGDPGQRRQARAGRMTPAATAFGSEILSSSPSPSHCAVSDPANVESMSREAPRA